MLQDRALVEVAREVVVYGVFYGDAIEVANRPEVCNTVFHVAYKANFRRQRHY